MIQKIIFRYFKRYFYKWPGLIVGFLIILYFINFDLNFSKFIKNNFYLCLINSAFLLIWLILWIYHRNNFPSTNKNKVGIIIAIDAENEKQKNRLKSDFVERINDSLKEHGLNSQFEILSLSDHRSLSAINILRNYTAKKDELKKHAFNVNSAFKKPKEIKKWERFKNKTRGYFFIWGNIRERLDLDNKYILKLDGLVIHKPIIPPTSEKMAKEMIAAFPREFSFYEKFELKGFQIAADSIYYSARYITGVAALISGDPFTAIKLHNGLKEKINRLGKPIESNLEYIVKSVDEMVNLANLLIARYYYFIKNDPQKAKGYLYDCLNKASNPYDALIFASVIAFKNDRNPVQSLRYLNLAGRLPQQDKTWLYNKAFIYMYLNKFKKALNIYKRIGRESYIGEDVTVSLCINFNESLIKDEPNKIQCLFVLGFLYYKKKLNYPLALEKFEQFQEKIKDKEEFTYLRAVANTYLQEIKAAMNIG